MRAVLIGGAALAVSICPCLGQAAADETADPSAAGAGRYGVTLQRPLFSPTRRPPPPAAPLAQPVAPMAALPAPPPDVALSGIIAGGGGGVALLRRPQDAAPIRVVPGAQVDGWTVAEIRPRAIVLRRDARSVTVDLPAPPR